MVLKLVGNYCICEEKTIKNTTSNDRWVQKILQKCSECTRRSSLIGWLSIPFSPISPFFSLGNGDFPSVQRVQQYRDFLHFFKSIFSPNFPSRLKPYQDSKKVWVRRVYCLNVVLNGRENWGKSTFFLSVKNPCIVGPSVQRYADCQNY